MLIVKAFSSFFSFRCFFSDYSVGPGNKNWRIKQDIQGQFFLWMLAQLASYGNILQCFRYAEAIFLLFQTRVQRVQKVAEVVCRKFTIYHLSPCYSRKVRAHNLEFTERGNDAQ